MKRIKTKKQLTIYLDGKDSITNYYNMNNYLQWRDDIILSLHIRDKVKIGCEITVFGNILKSEVEEIHKGEDQEITIHKVINILTMYMNPRYDYCLDIDNDTKIIYKFDDNKELLTLFDTSTKKELSFNQRPLNFYLKDQACNKLTEYCDIISDIIINDDMSDFDRTNLIDQIINDIYSNKPLKQILDEYDILYYDINDILKEK